MSVNEILMEPFKVHPDVLPREAWSKRISDLFEQVGLRPEYAARFPHEFSGGQLQRIGIARALVLQPDLVILDEPVSALDVSVQAQVINLLMELQRNLGVTYIIIAHDLSVVRHISNRVAVMYLGKIVEIGDADDIYDRPAHPYTYALLSVEPKITLDKSREEAHFAYRRGPESYQSAFRMPLSHPLLEGAGEVSGNPPRSFTL